MALLDIFRNFGEKMGKGMERNIGGLLGVDPEDMTEAEKKQARRLSQMAVFDALARGTTPTAGIQNAAALLGAQREERSQRQRQQAAEQEIGRITGRLFGGAPAAPADMGEDETGLGTVAIQSRYRQSPQEALARMYGTSAGRDVAQMAPGLLELAQEGVKGRTVGGSVYNPLTGEFTKPPEEKKPRLPVREVDSGREKIVYFDDGTVERIPKTLAPGAGGRAVGAGGIKPTKGQEAVDKKFSDTIVDYVAEGGYADVEKQIGQLEQVIGALESGKSNITGPGIAMLAENMPNVAAGMYPEAINAKDLVEEVAQRNLRAILGAQFAQTEGAQLIKRAYNPALSEEQNAARLRSLVQQMRQANTAKRDALDYWNKYGTLAGYEGKLPPATITIGESGKKKTRKVGGFTITEEP